MPGKRKGRLVALEGSRGTRLAAAAAHLARAIGTEEECGYTLWDASNLFYEMRTAKAKKHAPNARVLMLLYAADLAFRLRWEIRPALENGMIVVAAPYVESAVAFGVATGLEKEWMQELFRFAEEPDTVYRIPENAEYPTDKPKAADGFLEFACNMMKHGESPVAPETVWKGFHEYFHELERMHGCRTL